MASLIIRNGKFIRDGKEEPVKIGDPDQIKVLKEQVAYIEELSGEGVMIDDLLAIQDLEDDDGDEIEELILEFECICTYIISKSYDIHYATNLNLFENKKIKCGKCGKRYVITEHEDEFYYVLKLLK